MHACTTVANGSSLTRNQSKSIATSERSQLQRNQPHSIASAAASAVTPSSSRGRQNFRPLPYQTHAKIDAFFGVTASQKRELHLRSKDEDGTVWYDATEREEWRHLLAPSSPGTALLCTSRDGLTRRRSSTLSSLFPSATSALTEANTSLTPTLNAFSFSIIEYGSGETDVPRRKRLKRSNSAMARAKLVQDRLLHESTGEDGRMWISVAPYKRRASTGADCDHQDEDAIEPQTLAGTIHISRLPLERRKATKELLDEAFHFVAADQSIGGGMVRTHRPRPLALSSSTGSPLTTAAAAARRYSYGEQTPSTASPSSSSPLPTAAIAFTRRRSLPHTPSSASSDLAYPRVLSPSAFSHARKEAAIRRLRRNTFGTIVDEDGEADIDAPPISAISYISTASSKCVEMLASPSLFEGEEETGMKSRRDGVILAPAPRQQTSTSSLRTIALSDGGRSIDVDAASTRRKHTLSVQRAVDSSVRPATPASSLSSSSFSSLNSHYVRHDGGGLTPRQAHRRCAVLPPPIPSPPSSPIRPTPSLSIPQHQVDDQPDKSPSKRYKISSGLRTGLHVYDGVEIPCAAVHLSSDAEDENDDDDDDVEGGDGSVTGSERFKSASVGKKRMKVKKWFAKVVK